MSEEQRIADEIGHGPPVEEPSPCPGTHTGGPARGALAWIKRAARSGARQPDERFVGLLGRAAVLGAVVGVVLGAAAGWVLTGFLTLTSLAVLGTVGVGAFIGGTIGALLFPVAASPESQAGEPEQELLRAGQRASGDVPPRR